MLRTLYSDLREADGARLETEGILGSPKYEFQTLKHIKEDVKDAQREMFLERKFDNELVYNLLNDGDSIYDTVRFLNEDMKGIKKFLPRARDKKYNGIVKQLEELVPGANYFKRSGILYPDNFFSGGLLISGIASAGSLWVSNYVKSDEPGFSLLAFAFMTVATMPFSGAVMQSIGRSKRFLKQATEGAQYIDNTFERLFK